jgi:glycerol uptake facilitator protein
MSASLQRRLVAELLGTGLLIVFGPGSVVAALTVGKGALNYAGLGIISLSFAFVVALVIYTIGSTSGAHINPAVSIGLAVVHRFPWKEVIPYVLAQLVGALLGGLVLVGIFGKVAVHLGAGTGAVELAPHVSIASGLGAEAMGTFLLVFAIMGLAIDRRAPGGWAGLMIGLAVFVSIVVVGPLTGSAINPARAFGPYVVNSIFGGSVPWTNFWFIYVIGDLLGGILAAVTYELLARPARTEAA